MLESSSMFSWRMVLFLIINIFIMVAERYINRTMARVTIKKLGSKEGEKGDLEVSEETIMERLR